MQNSTQSVNPIVTFGVCFKNCENAVNDVINTILEQDFPHDRLEIIFVDDGSTDGTLAAIYSNTKNVDIPIKIFHHEWKGLGPSRNVVVNNASGTYLVWVDANMSLAKDYVSTHVKAMSSNPKIGIAKGICNLSNTDSLVATLENVGWLVNHVKNERNASKLIHLGTAGCMYRVTAIKDVGGFDEDITTAGEDTDAAYRLSSAGWFFYLSKKTTFYVSRPKTWNAIWKSYRNYGYAFHYLYLKDKHMISFYKMMPFAGLISGLLDSIFAYKLTHKKIVFLLPIHYFFRMTAWLSGFINSYVSKK